jgi:hypothetical protein
MPKHLTFRQASISAAKASMARAPNTFKQGDITRAVKGARAAGVEVARIEIDQTGKIIIQLANAGAKEQAVPDDLDRELAEFKRQHGEG